MKKFLFLTNIIISLLIINSCNPKEETASNKIVPIQEAPVVETKQTDPQQSWKESLLSGKAIETEKDIESIKLIIEKAVENNRLDELQTFLETESKKEKVPPQILFGLSLVYGRKGLVKEEYKAIEKLEEQVKQRPGIVFNLSLVYGRKEQLKTEIKDSSILYHAPPGFALVKGGTYKMVNIKDFFIKKKEISFLEYDLYCSKSDVKKPSDNSWGRGSNPAMNISWLDAVMYCNWLSSEKGLEKCYSISGSDVSCDFSKNGFRLPTEAEWEYAASGGTDSKDYIYSGSNKPENAGWYADISGGHPHKTGNLTANELGIYDMSGNVWEWCWDWFNNTADYSTNGPVTGKYKVVKGGSWSYFKEDIIITSRGRLFPGDKNTNTGFRIVQNVK